MPEPTDQSEFDDDQLDDSRLNDELLSAYVDGELQGEELAQVEQRLAVDPAAQQLVDELRALSGELKSLPRETVGDSLRSSVMQRAERAMLLGGSEQSTLPDREAGSSRRWLWAAMALAATLLLSLYLSDTQIEEPVIASAEPLPDEKSKRNMRIEAVKPAANELADLAEEVPNEVPVDESMEFASGPKGVPAVVDGFSKQDSSGPAVASTMQARAAIAADFDDQQQDPAFDASSLACEVHITMGDGRKSIAQFDRVLNQLGIVLRNNENLAASSSDSAKEGTDATEFVLVEAPVEQIAGTLAACNVDNFNCPTIQIIDESKQPQPIVARLRQWERDADEAPVKPFPAKQLSSIATHMPVASRRQLGRATRIDQAKLSKPVDRERASRQRMEDQRMGYSGSLLANGRVRVLFVLQSAADLPDPIEIKLEDEPATGQ